MTARRFLFLGFILALAAFTPGCAFSPDRWTVEERTERQSKNGRWGEGEVGVSISGPIPHPTSHE